MKSPHSRPAAVTPFEISRRTFLKRCTMLAAATGLPLWFVQRQELAAAETV